MNILFIGPYRQNDGWGYCAKNYIRALMTTEHNIAIRPIYMAKSASNDIDEDLEALEAKRYEHYDCIIQNVLPNYFGNNIKSKSTVNILMTTLETENLQVHPWYNTFLNVKNIFVKSQRECEVLKEVIPNISAYDIGEVLSIKSDIDCKPLRDKQGDFLFYTIGSHSDNQNITSLIRAFHNEFDANEPVNLMLRINKPGHTSLSASQEFQGVLNQIKGIMRKYSKTTFYKDEILVIGEESDIVNRIHKTGDCFVSVNRGGSWNTDAIISMRFGNVPLIYDKTGLSDFITEEEGYHIKTNPQHILHSQSPIPNIYTAFEQWRDSDIMSIQKGLRRVYEDHKNSEETFKNETMDLVWGPEGLKIKPTLFQKKRNGIQKSQQFTHKYIGKKMSEALEHATN